MGGRTPARVCRQAVNPNCGVPYVFKSDADPNVHFVTTILESKSAYKKFADSPEQDKRFHWIRELLAADPEWHDGEVVHHDTKVEATR